MAPLFEESYSSIFPCVDNKIDDDGLIGVSEEISPFMILDAIVHGIFPWPMCFNWDNESQDVTLESGKKDVLVDKDVSIEAVNQYSNTATDVNRLNYLYEKNELPFLLKDLSLRTCLAQWEGKNFLSLDSLASSNSELAWWSPNPRAILDLDELHIPKRLKRTIKSNKFIVTYDQAFPEVMIACATSGNRQLSGSWITQELYACYCKLFELGYAHSVECWIKESSEERVSQSDEESNRKLVGGLYGVAINGFFDGESMFSSVTDASKVALFTLALRLKKNGFKLFDLQILNSHTQSLGGMEISRSEYLNRLNEAVQTPVVF